jgi:hypothetical protein
MTKKAFNEHAVNDRREIKKFVTELHKRKNGSPIKHFFFLHEEDYLILMWANDIKDLAKQSKGGEKGDAYWQNIIDLVVDGKFKDAALKYFEAHRNDTEQLGFLFRACWNSVNLPLARVLYEALGEGGFK